MLGNGFGIPPFWDSNDKLQKKRFSMYYESMTGDSLWSTVTKKIKWSRQFSESFGTSETFPLWRDSTAYPYFQTLPPNRKQSKITSQSPCTRQFSGTIHTGPVALSSRSVFHCSFPSKRYTLPFIEIPHEAYIVFIFRFILGYFPKIDRPLRPCLYILYTQKTKQMIVDLWQPIRGATGRTPWPSVLQHLVHLVWHPAAQEEVLSDHLRLARKPSHGINPQTGEKALNIAKTAVFMKGFTAVDSEIID